MWTFVPAYISPKDPLPILGPTLNFLATRSSIEIAAKNLRTWSGSSQKQLGKFLRDVDDKKRFQTLQVCRLIDSWRSLMSELRLVNSCVIFHTLVYRWRFRISRWRRWSSQNKEKRINSGIICLLGSDQPHENKRKCRNARNKAESVGHRFVFTKLLCGAWGGSGERISDFEIESKFQLLRERTVLYGQKL